MREGPGVWCFWPTLESHCWHHSFLTQSHAATADLASGLCEPVFGVERVTNRLKLFAYGQRAIGEASHSLKYHNCAVISDLYEQNPAAAHERRLTHCCCNPPFLGCSPYKGVRCERNCKLVL